MSERSPRGQEADRRPRTGPPRTPDSAAAPSPSTVLLDLQRTAGNRAVSRLVQRVAVTAPTTEETLFNQSKRDGKAGAAVFGGASGATFDLSRAGSPEAVTVTVRIRFVQEGRNRDGTDKGDMSVIPAGDARRPFAQNICDTSPPHWNNRAVLVATRAASGPTTPPAVPDPGGPVRLPVRFRAVPVFDLAPVPADVEIRVFPQSVQAGGSQHPIDAGHFYMNKGPNYSANDEAIYAHEYGHLIGLNDEYSQSNPQMHALLHQLDPGTAGARGQAMDREAVRRMVMAALTRPLMNRISRSTGEIAGVLAKGSKPVTQALGTALGGALTDPSVIANFMLTVPPTAAALIPEIGGLVNGAVRDRRNTSGLAGQVVPAQFAAGPLGRRIRATYFAALDGATTAAVDVGGISMTIDVGGNAGIDAAGNAVIRPSGLWAGGGADRSSIASTVDASAGAARTGRVPPVRASDSVLAQLTALPAAWSGLAGAAPSTLSAGTLAADLNSALISALEARLLALLSGPHPDAPTRLTRRRALAAAISTAVHNAAKVAAVNAVRAFQKSQIEPILKSSVSTVMTAIGTEVTRVMGTPAEQLALTTSRDPAIAAVVATMKTKLETQAAAAKTAQTTAGRPAINPGTTAPDQQVTYSTVNMMSDNSDVFRPDQFAHVATLFNASPPLRREREGDFHIEMGAT